MLTVNNQQLIRAATIIANAGDLSDEELAQRPIDDGFEEPVAYRLVAFLPSAFARPVLEELGVSNFAPASVPTEDGREFSVVLDNQPEYRAALALAREHRRKGVIPHEVFKAVVDSSAEIDAISNALNEGAEVDGAVVALALNSASHARYVVRRKAWWRRWR